MEDYSIAVLFFCCIQWFIMLCFCHRKNPQHGNNIVDTAIGVRYFLYISIIIYLAFTFSYIRDTNQYNNEVRNYNNIINTPYQCSVVGNTNQWYNTSVKFNMIFITPANNYQNNTVDCYSIKCYNYYLTNNPINCYYAEDYFLQFNTTLREEIPLRHSINRIIASLVLTCVLVIIDIIHGILVFCQ